MSSGSEFVENTGAQQCSCDDVESVLMKATEWRPDGSQ